MAGLPTFKIPHPVKGRLKMTEDVCQAHSGLEERIKAVEKGQTGIQTSIDGIKEKQSESERKQARWSGAIAVLVVLVPILLKIYDIIR